MHRNGWGPVNQSISLGLLRLLTSADQEIPESIQVGWSSSDEHRFSADSGQRLPG